MARRWAIVLLLMALALSFAAPVSAHTTLGDLTGTSPYRTNDNELTTSPPGNHVPGPLGYVWPGSGLDTYSGVPSNPPGYQSPFTDQQPLQDAGDSYSPEGAILTSTADHDSVGDLIFALNFSNPNAFPQPEPIQLHKPRNLHPRTCLRCDWKTHPRWFRTYRWNQLGSRR